MKIKFKFVMRWILILDNKNKIALLWKEIGMMCPMGLRSLKLRIMLLSKIMLI